MIQEENAPHNVRDTMRALVNQQRDEHKADRLPGVKDFGGRGGVGPRNVSHKIARQAGETLTITIKMSDDNDPFVVCEHDHRKPKKMARAKVAGYCDGLTRDGWSMQQLNGVLTFTKEWQPQ